MGRSETDRPASLLLRCQRRQCGGAIGEGNPEEVRLGIFEQHQRLQHVLHVARKVTQKRFAAVSAGSFGKANQDAHKCGPEVIQLGDWGVFHGKKERTGADTSA